MILGIGKSYERRNKRLIVQKKACFWYKCNMTKWGYQEQKRGLNMKGKKVKKKDK
jgi:hypothetical protein